MLEVIGGPEDVVVSEDDQFGGDMGHGSQNLSTVAENEDGEQNKRPEVRAAVRCVIRTSTQLAATPSHDCDQVVVEVIEVPGMVAGVRGEACSSWIRRAKNSTGEFLASRAGGLQTSVETSVEKSVGGCGCSRDSSCRMPKGTLWLR
jgi:hypothetical protein